MLRHTILPASLFTICILVAFFTGIVTDIGLVLVRVSAVFLFWTVCPRIRAVVAPRAIVDKRAISANVYKRTKSNMIPAYVIFFHLALQRSHIIYIQDCIHRRRVLSPPARAPKNDLFFSVVKYLVHGARWS